MKAVLIAVNRVFIQFNFLIVRTRIFKSMIKVILIFKCEDRFLCTIDYLESWTFAPSNRNKKILKTLLVYKSIICPSDFWVNFYWGIENGWLNSWNALKYTLQEQSFLNGKLFNMMMAGSFHSMKMSCFRYPVITAE